MTEGAFGTLEQALRQGMQLLTSDPPVAEAQAREILKLVPQQPQALLLLGMALRTQRNYAAALEVLQPLAASQPATAPVHLQLGLTLRAAGRCDEAITAIRRAVSLAPDLAHAWQALGDTLAQSGERAGAERAHACQVSVSDPRMQQAMTALHAGRPAEAESLLRGILDHRADDPVALWVLSQSMARLGRHHETELLLTRCLELAPDFDAARHNYAIVLFFQAKAPAALKEVDLLLSRDPLNPSYRLMKATSLTQIGEYGQALTCFAGVLADYPNQPKEWMSYGHVLKTLGRKDEAVTAYHKARTLLPSLGQAWWSLANLKTYRFSHAEIQAMEVQLARADLADEDRAQIHFALGKAFEDGGFYESSFENYLKGATMRRAAVSYEAEATTAHAERSKAVFTPAYFAKRKHAGCPAPDPIFIVGLPRAGSTLVEQILSSHSAVEGTMELPNIAALVKRLDGPKSKDSGSSYPERVLELEDTALTALGEEFIESTRMLRKLDRPFFIDKMPNNFAHIGLIHTILPNARIIHVRRHPMGCCFSAFKQYFARGQNFSYDLSELGRYYVDYVGMMDHFDQVLPGVVHRVVYEQLVAEPESEIRALLAYCGLPFEDACLRFYENDRPVRDSQH